MVIGIVVRRSVSERSFGEAPDLKSCEKGVVQADHIIGYIEVGYEIDVPAREVSLEHEGALALCSFGARCG
ncbi:hypothetical protein [Microvirga lotononidis]|uniref:hypothetical protein n=1 Tax=Microvirga lotononidis TaxID=864069 RepID=UPI000308BE96|nr:hypothetical protein [Microvirga lotononidis]WQO31963.1 hypothetical protein U0023_32015 [Microvirga lotononidis]